MDCETTGSKRNWDRGIEYCIMTHDEKGSLIDCFTQRVNNDGVRIKPSAYAVHGISYSDLVDECKFPEVGRRMNNFFDRNLRGFDSGVLVAHNGATDFQFLCCCGTLTWLRPRYAGSYASPYRCPHKYCQRWYRLNYKAARNIIASYDAVASEYS